MSSRSREDSDAALLGEGSRRAGGGNDIEEAEMEEFMDDILSPKEASPSSSPRSIHLSSDESGGEDARRSSTRNREDQRNSSLLRRKSSVSRGGGLATEEVAGEEISGTVVGKARRRRSSEGIIDRCEAGKPR